MEEIKLTGESKDIVSENISKLREIFPDIFSEDKIDFDKLKADLGEYIDDSHEKYNFTWPGKTQAIKESQKQSTGTLRPCKEESEHWDKTQNMYIEGDNLEVLKLLQKSYYNRIKCIYIDPPYNTGKDFIYSDNYQDNLENYLKVSGQLKESEEGNIGIKLSTNTETAGRYHSNWLNMMYPRLKLSRNLLTDDGVIFISIDDHEVTHLRNICDEIFGEENFVAQLIWEQGRKSMAAQIAVNHEYCLVYCKNRKINMELSDDNDWKIKKDGLNSIYAEYDKLKDEYGNNYKAIEKGLQEYYKSLSDNNPAKRHSHFRCVDENGIYNPDNISQGTGKGGKYDVIHPITKKPCKVPSGGYRFSEENMEILLKENKIHFGKDHTIVPCIKRYLKDTEYEVMASVFYKDGRGASKKLDSLIGKSIFKFPKDDEIIKMFLSLIVKENDIILDFFSGSATTAESVMKLYDENDSNLRFILVQIPEVDDTNSEYDTICDIGKKRMKLVGANYNSDVGFKVFKLDSSNLEKWEPDYNNIQQSLIVDEIKKDRTNEDIVYEIMLKYGVDLTLPIEQHDNIYSIGFGALIVCLSDNITIDITNTILEISKMSSVSRVVFKDSGFASDSDKTNIKEILKTNHIDEFITI